MQSQPSRPNVLHPEKLLPMSMVHVNGVAVLCVHVASEKEDLCQEATKLLQNALSVHTSVTGFVREIDYSYVGDDSSSPQIQFYLRCKESLDCHDKYKNALYLMGFVTASGPFEGCCAIGLGGKKIARLRAMYLSLAFTLLVRHNEARKSTVQYKDHPAWFSHYELAARTLGVSPIEPWEVSYEMLDDPGEDSEELVPEPITCVEKADLKLRLEAAIRDARDCPGAPIRFDSRFPEWPLRFARGWTKGDALDLKGLRILIIGTPICGWKSNEAPYFPDDILKDFIVLFLDRNVGRLQYGSRLAKYKRGDEATWSGCTDRRAPQAAWDVIELSFLWVPILTYR